VAFGEKLRVPVNVKKTEARTLEQAKAQGADIRPIASPSEAVTIANKNPQQKVVFFAAGFETTTAPVAAMMVEGVPENLSVLLSGRLTWPAIAMLLESSEPGFNALIAPGHVATIMGPEEWSFVVEKHNIPAAVAGFTTGNPASGNVLHITPARRRKTLSRQLLWRSCAPGRQRDGPTLPQPGDGGR